MTLEECIRKEEEIDHFLDNYKDIREEIDSFFSDDINDKDVQKLLEYHQLINDYLSFTERDELLDLKNRILNKTKEIRDYRDPKPSISRIMNYGQGMHHIFRQKYELNERKYDRDILVINELKDRIKKETEDNKHSKEYGKKLIKKVNDGLKEEIDKLSNAEKKLYKAYENTDNNSEKLFYEEQLIIAKSCKEIVYRGLS
ncbi:MAG: hypothetical protein ACQEP1_01400 [Nanobdellota archaeon]